jgi:hypothetical protein
MLPGRGSVRAAESKLPRDVSSPSQQAVEQWLCFNYPCTARDWLQRLQAVRRTSGDALARGLATQWHYLVLPEGKSLVLQWSIRVRRSAREAFRRHVAPELEDGSPAAYVPRVKKFGRKSLGVCETLCWISSEAAADLLDVRWPGRETRLVLAVILQRQLVMALSSALSVSPRETVKLYRDRLVRIGAGGDAERGADRFRAIARVARSAFNPGRLRSLERMLRPRLTPTTRRYREEAERLKGVLLRHPLPLAARSTPDRPIHEILIHRLMHLLSFRLCLSLIDEALVAEIVLLSMGAAPKTGPR